MALNCPTCDSHCNAPVSVLAFPALLAFLMSVYTACVVTRPKKKAPMMRYPTAMAIRVTYFFLESSYFTKPCFSTWRRHRPEKKNIVIKCSTLMISHHHFLAATKQLYEWYFLSVCLSVCLSVTPFWLCSHHCIIMKLSGVITKDQGNVHAKGQGQRSKVKVTEVTTQLSRFRTVTSVWIHIWRWNDTYSLILLRRGALLFFKVIRQISRSHGAKNRRIWPRLGVSGLILKFEFANGYEMLHKAWSNIEEVPYFFSRSSVKLQGRTALKIV